ncbi:MAG: zinc-ribbon domain-containing protein [Bacilli bacterium]|nr:zinc-ribbon domain-containing protein [Bacilli bacterium]
MNCPRCNSQIQAGNSFCSSCGFNLNEQNNVNNNNFGNQQNMNMNNQQMMYPNQMQQGNYNQFQQGTVQKGKLGKLAIFMMVLDFIALPLMILQLSGGALKFDTVAFWVFCNLVVFLGDAKKRKNNINK